LKLHGNTEEEHVVLGLLDVARSIHDFTSLDLTYSEISENQSDMLVESCEELPLEIPVAHAEAFPFESVQEYSKYFFTNENNGQQVVSFLLENGHKSYNKELKQ